MHRRSICSPIHMHPHSQGAPTHGTRASSATATLGIFRSLPPKSRSRGNCFRSWQLQSFAAFIHLPSTASPRPHKCAAATPSLRAHQIFQPIGEHVLSKWSHEVLLYGIHHRRTDGVSDRQLLLSRRTGMESSKTPDSGTRIFSPPPANRAW